MVFRWLKRFLPRGLYGRAVLILLVPVVAVQLVVSVVFLQRHFDRVTEQMTRSVAIPLGYVLDAVGRAPDREAAARLAREVGGALGFAVRLPAGEVADGRLFYDLTGRSVVRTLREVLPAVGAIDLASDTGLVRLAAQTAQGPVEVEFRRSRVSASNPHQLLVIMVLAGILLTAVAFVFLRNQLRPITRLAEAAEAYGRGRIVPYRPRGATEVRAAGRAFLEMRARLEEAKAQRTLLLSGVSHDLRTPLTRLRLGLSLMPEDEDVRAMARDVAEMEQMVDAFLDHARGEWTGAVEPAVPADLARRVAENAARLGRRVELVLAEGAEAPAGLRLRAVERALENLVQNALRHGSRVRLTVAGGPGGARFAVEDDGPGIPPERREEALTPFTRLDPARNLDSGGGAGLGLAIASEVARSHGGRLTLGESADLGGLRAELVLGP
ncbi:MAG: ATP-binding protein [Rhodobacteraceae bacterium]|nr:ATP-binding protein [Paracoccaceae bacterium]